MQSTEYCAAKPAPASSAGLTWLLSDGRPGHMAQLRGLARALTRRQPMRLEWIDVADHPVGWWHLVRGVYPGLPRHDPPDLAVAAGHATHRALLALGRATGCMTCVLMRPSLPLRCFDAAIIPQHDRPPASSRVLVTDGVLNPITPARHPDTGRGLILLGGPSRHYDFPEERVRQQVLSLCAHFPGMQWTASSSRRTPAGVLAALEQSGCANLELVDHASTPPDWVGYMLDRCGQVWITEDSVSMVYEALSAGLSTGLIALPSRRDGRLQRGLQELRHRAPLNRLGDVLAGQTPEPPRRPLQEAQRAADWLLQRLPARAST